MGQRGALATVTGGFGIGEGAARIGDCGRGCRPRRPGREIGRQDGQRRQRVGLGQRRCLARTGALKLLAEGGEGVGHGLGHAGQVGRIDQAGLPDRLDLQPGRAQRLHGVLFLGRGNFLADQPAGAELAHQFR